MVKRPANLHDVARMADVSYQTVSRVVNNKPNVKETTRQRVLKAIEQLDYRPNRAARSLLTGRSQVIQLISFDVYYFTPLPAIFTEIHNHGYHSGLSILNQPHSKAALHRIMDELTARMIDGFIFFNPQIDLEYEEYQRMCRGIPFIQVGSGPGPMVPSVVFDQEFGMRQLMEHLFSLGHRQIVEIPGDPSNFDANQRHKTYVQMMESRGLEPRFFLCNDQSYPFFTNEGGYCSTLELIRRGEQFTALVCGNDESAFGALRALHEMGYRVPQDVSVTGFDDNHSTPYFEPPLTTVRQDYLLLSQQSLNYLLTMINQPETPHYKQVIYPRLVVRQSTAAIA